MATTDIASRKAEGEFARQVNDLILPQWWTGTAARDASEYTIDASPYVASGPLHDNPEFAARMRQTFHEVGLVHVINTGKTELADMRLAAKVVLDTEMAYEGGANPRDAIEPNVYEVGAPLAAHLHYHHEMAYIEQSTKMLAFLAKKALPGRGATWVSDNVAVTNAILATEFGKKLAEKGVCYHRLLSDREAFADKLEEGVYNHWQKSLGTDDPAEAAARAQERGLITEWGDDRLLRTKFYVSAFEYFPQLDRNLLYSSVADHGMWFDAWPLVMHLPYEQRPLHMTYGDDTEITKDELRQFVAAYDQFGIPIDWRQGDLAIVCNYRFAHGRPGIELGDGEERELGVLLGEKYRRVGALAGKW